MFFDQNSLLNLSLLVWLPLLSSLVILILPSQKISSQDDAEGNGNINIAKFWTGIVTMITFLISINFAFDSSKADSQFIERFNWAPAFGISYSLTLDGISLVFALLTTLSFFVATVFTSTKSILKKGFSAKGFFFCLLVLETALLGGFLASDLFLFYAFWEFMLIPIFYLIGVFGGQNKSTASFRFVIYTLTGSVLMLVAIIYLSYMYNLQTMDMYGRGKLSFLLSDLINLRLSLNEEYLLFGAFALAFAVKLPIFPFHTWLPSVYNESPDTTTALLSAVVSKIGLYGLIRYCLYLFPNASDHLAPVMILLAVIGIVYAALLAWSQQEIKKILAYSSVSHLGFCIIGLFALKEGSINGAIFHAFSHGVISLSLFLFVGLITEKFLTLDIARVSSIAKNSPVFSILFFIALLGSVSLPLTSGFAGEFMILVESYNKFPISTFIALIAGVLSAIYMLTLFREAFFRDITESLGNKASVIKLGMLKFLVAFCCICAVILFGVKPSLITSLSKLSVSKLVLTVSEATKNDVTKDNNKISERVLNTI